MAPFGTRSQALEFLPLQNLQKLVLIPCYAGDKPCAESLFETHWSPAACGILPKPEFLETLLEKCPSLQVHVAFEAYCSSCHANYNKKVRHCIRPSIDAHESDTGLQSELQYYKMLQLSGDDADECVYVYPGGRFGLKLEKITSRPWDGKEGDHEEDIKEGSNQKTSEGTNAQPV